MTLKEPRMVAAVPRGRVILAADAPEYLRLTPVIGVVTATRCRLCTIGVSVGMANPRRLRSPQTPQRAA